MLDLIQCTIVDGRAYVRLPRQLNKAFTKCFKGAFWDSSANAWVFGRYANFGRRLEQFENVFKNKIERLQRLDEEDLATKEFRELRAEVDSLADYLEEIGLTMTRYELIEHRIPNLKEDIPRYLQAIGYAHLTLVKRRSELLDLIDKELKDNWNL